MRSKYFRKFSFIVERYPIEVFTFEILIGLLIEPGLKMAVFLFAGVIFTAVFSEGLKIFFKEKRPEEALKRKFYAKTFALNRRSFPSSHSAVAIFFPTIFFGTALFAPFLLFALVVMYSRVYINSHRPRDILGGALIGIFIGVLSLQIIQNLRI